MHTGDRKGAGMRVERKALRRESDAVPEAGLDSKVIYDSSKIQVLGMTQDERWLAKYNEVKSFIETNLRNPSKHNPIERGLYLNWLKHNRQLMNQGELKPERLEAFKELLALMEENKHVNQYV